MCLQNVALAKGRLPTTFQPLVWLHKEALLVDFFFFVNLTKASFLGTLVKKMPLSD